MNSARVWLAALVSVALAAGVSWEWLDRPIAVWLHEHQLAAHGRGLLNPLTQIPDPLIPAGGVLFVVLGIRALLGRPFRKGYAVAIVCCFSVIVGETMKNGLKWFFGRPWPESWRGNPSFIRDHAYAFHWFHGGNGYESFPSGHMTATAAVLSVLWLCYPRLRALYVVVTCGIGAGLVLSNFHFFSDVIAGAFLGASVGWMTTFLFEKAPHLVGPAPPD